MKAHIQMDKVAHSAYRYTGKYNAFCVLRFLLVFRYSNNYNEWDTGQLNMGKTLAAFLMDYYSHRLNLQSHVLLLFLDASIIELHQRKAQYLLILKVFL